MLPRSLNPHRDGLPPPGDSPVRPAHEDAQSNRRAISRARPPTALPSGASVILWRQRYRAAPARSCHARR